MSIKATVTKDKTASRKYPYLGWSPTHDFYVLFVAPKTGMVVADVGRNTGSDRLGEWAHGWLEEEYFVHAKDKVTIEND